MKSGSECFEHQPSLVIPIRVPNATNVRFVAAFQESAGPTNPCHRRRAPSAKTTPIRCGSVTARFFFSEGRKEIQPLHRRGPPQAPARVSMNSLRHFDHSHLVHWRLVDPMRGRTASPIEPMMLPRRIPHLVKLVWKRQSAIITGILLRLFFSWQRHVVPGIGYLSLVLPRTPNGIAAPAHHFRLARQRVQEVAILREDDEIVRRHESQTTR